MGRREDSRASVYQRPKADWQACGDRHGDRTRQSLDPPSRKAAHRVAPGQGNCSSEPKTEMQVLKRKKKEIIFICKFTWDVIKGFNKSSVLVH